MVESADTRDLKSLGLTSVPVQVRSAAPRIYAGFIIIIDDKSCFFIVKSEVNKMISRKTTTSSSEIVSIPNDYLCDPELSIDGVGFFTFLINLSQSDNDFVWDYDNVVDRYSSRFPDIENYLKELKEKGYLRIIDQDTKPEIEFDGYKHTGWL